MRAVIIGEAGDLLFDDTLRDGRRVPTGVKSPHQPRTPTPPGPSFSCRAWCVYQHQVALTTNPSEELAAITRHALGAARAVPGSSHQ